ncbi:MAG: hydroxymethylglutaryl-CoA synthase [Candidatus Peribacteraceae bacterium]|nr:hydroxymethylglutaryl-CoA synthase [Candidatus Peribacteraceae bacterium]
MPDNHSAIIGFGMCLPNERIRVADIAAHWGQDGEMVSKSIGVREKTVPGEGEDAFTLAFEAGKQAIEIAGIQSSEISAVFVGSESHPYAVKPTSGMVAQALGVHPFCHCADLEFACKAGTAGMQIVDAFVRSKQIRYGLAIGSDTAQAAPGDALEYTAAAGAAAMILGPEKSKDAICRIEQTLSFTTDTPDFWRASKESYPNHGGRFTGEPGYFHHMRETIRGTLETAKIAVQELSHIILHMPNGKFPSRIAKECGFTKEQMAKGFIVPHIGNTYSACSMIGLAHVLQEAKKDEKILLVSYGSGAGCDAFLMTMLRDGIALKPDERETAYVSYSELRRRAETLATH